jgi:D-alanyl-D-alanine carboxypeptidase
MIQTAHRWLRTIPLGLVFILLSVFAGYQIWQNQILEQKFSSLENTLSSTVLSLQDLASSTQSRFEVTALKNTELSSLLSNEQGRLDELGDDVHDFDREVGKLSGSVETLEKLTTTDPELLQKYSTVYFLNEHYLPADLVVIDEKYDLVNGKEVTIHAEVWPFLKDLLRAAGRKDIDLMVLSGYRSFAEQTTLKESYTTRYGAGANQFSADQGYSEHQLGTTVDLTTKENGEYLEGFETSRAFEWLIENAYEYGFTLSYPEGNAYYTYEPWHWRFVGIDLASDLERKDKHFYDLDQRDLDSYIATLFDD